MRQYSLGLFDSILDRNFPGGDVKNLTEIAEEWSRSIRYPGGFWRGTFTLFPGVMDVHEAFDQWIGFHVSERAGGIESWEGFIAEMVLYKAGSIRRKSLAEMWNAVRARYRDDADSDAVDSTYVTQASSITRYGRKEQMLFLDGYPLATAQAAINAELNDNGYPKARASAFGMSGDTFLDVTVLGYAHTANWMFQEEGNGAVNLSEWIEDIVGSEFGLSANHGGAVANAGDCQFLKTGEIDANTLQVSSSTAFPVRAWDVMANPSTGLTMAGILSGGEYVPAILWVDVGRLAYYAPINLDPRYQWDGGELFDAVGVPVVNPWAVRPAVVRDLTYPLRRRDRDSVFGDSRDVVVQEVEVDWYGNVTLRPEGYNITEILTARAREQQRLEEALDDTG